LFYTKFSLNQRAHRNHILRKVPKYIDFYFIYKEVKDKYGIIDMLSKQSFFKLMASLISDMRQSIDILSKIQKSVLS